MADDDKGESKLHGAAKSGGIQSKVRNLAPRSLLSTQLCFLLPSVLLLLTAFITPRVYLILTPSPDHDFGANSTFASALSLKFPTVIATDDTLTAGAEALETLSKDPSFASLSSDLSFSNETDADGEVVKAPVLDVDMQGLSAAEAEERRKREQALINEPSKCSCYRIKNNYCCAQVLCQCSAVCWNGKNLVAQVQHGHADVACLDPWYLQKYRMVMVDGDVISPLKCGEALPEKLQPLQVALDEGGLHDLHKRDMGWLEERKHLATWRLGATFFRHLDVRLASDASAFAGSLFPLLLINNASVPALLRPEIKHLLLPRDKFFRAIAEEHGSDGLIASILELLLRAALEPLNLGSGGFVLPEWSRKRVMSDEVPLDREEVLGGAQGGSGEGVRRNKHVEFERAWESATEMQPLCFERLFLPGTLKGSVYPNETIQAQAFKEQALRYLNLQPEPVPSSAGKVRLLFARRADVSDRVFEAESEARLMNLIKAVGFARIDILDVNPSMGVTNLPLPQVVQAVQNADVIIGLHGSALVYAGTFLRLGTVVLEIVPHHLFFSDIQILVAASGGLFVQHMLLPSPSPAAGPSASGRASVSTVDKGGNSTDAIDFPKWDEEYAKHTVSHCMNTKLNINCRQYFMRDRPIVLTEEDATDLKGLLGLGKHFAETTAVKGLDAARDELARQSLAVCKSGYMDLGLVSTDWLFDPNAKYKMCILKRTYWGD